MKEYTFNGAVCHSGQLTIIAKDFTNAIKKLEEHDYTYDDIKEYDYSHFEWDGESFEVVDLD